MDRLRGTRGGAASATGAVGAVLVTVLAGTAVSGCSPEAPRRVPEIVATSAGAEGAAPRTPADLRLGETVYDDGAPTTVLAARRPMRAPAFARPPAGEEWLGIRARTCSSPTSASDVGWYRFAAFGPSGERYAGGSWTRSDWPRVRFPQGRLPAGECGHGWLLIPVIPGRPARVVELSDASGRPLARWRLAGSA